MFISPVSFRGTYYLNIDTMGKERYWDEIKKSMIARTTLHSDVPTLKNKSYNGGMLIQYTTKGERADANINPITKEHLKKLTDDFISLDKIGMLHENLTLDNIYFYTDKEKSGVEITDFSDAGIFSLASKGIDVTSSRRINNIGGFELPSNAKNFEENGLREYLSTIKKYGERFNFIKDYLKIKAQYHEERAIERLMGGNTLADEDKSLVYEVVKGVVFKNPSDDVVKLELAKIESGTGAFRNKAIKMWQEGSGRFGKEPDMNLRFNAVLLMFESLRSAVGLKETVDELARRKHSNPKDLYFKLEQENINNLITNIYNQAIMLGDSNFHEEKLYPGKIIDIGSASEQKKFHSLCDDFKKLKDTEEIKDKINETIKYYGYLATRWISEKY